VLRVATRLIADGVRGRSDPIIVLSHAPPSGAGDGPDAYHLGFRAYRWLLDSFHPPLWLHGHVTTASVPSLNVSLGRTTLVNVTGSVLVELVPPR
jgi:Icc-related predicted phosphoesterase